jgi:triosephosphate isomerase
MGVSVFAQGGYQVKGVVVDAVGPVIGATVIEQGTSNGVSTGLDGDYTLTVSKADAVVEITCIGYATQTFVASQLVADFKGMPADDVAKVVIAYEPIWAIGTGKTATPDQAEEMCAFIRGVMGGVYSNEVADSMLILYGGSMKASNAADLLAKPDINGGLIGGASLKIDDFSAIINAANDLK